MQNIQQNVQYLQNCNLIKEIINLRIKEVLKDF